MIFDYKKEEEVAWMRMVQIISKWQGDRWHSESDFLRVLKAQFFWELANLRSLSKDELRWWINFQPKAFPSRESDEYDAGWSEALAEFTKKINE